MIPGHFILKFKLMIAGFHISVTITPKSGETFKGFLLKAVQQGQTDAVGSFDASAATVQTRCGVSSLQTRKENAYFVKINLCFVESHVFVILTGFKYGSYDYIYRPQRQEEFCRGGGGV